MNTLSTALSLFGVLLSTAFAFVAWANAQRANDAQAACARAAGKLNAMAGRVIALEGALESLTAQHRKLSGKFHAKNSETPAPPDVGLAPAELRTPAPPFCANWHDGQRDGPMSEAASCECDYCSEMRFRRNQMKLDLLAAARDATLGRSRSRE